MATLSTPPLILLLLQLIFLLAAAAPVDDICRQTKSPSRCRNILIAFDTRSATEELPVLAEIVIDEVTGNSRQIKLKVHDLFQSAKDLNLKRSYGDCENLYGGAVDALVTARKSLERRDYAKIVEADGVVGRAVGGCAAALEKEAKLKKRNEDVGVIVEAVGLIAKSLHLLI